MADQIQPQMMLPSGASPDDIDQYVKIEQQRRLGDLAMQFAQSGVQQPTNKVGPYYEATRMSPIGGIARVAAAVMAGKAQKDVTKADALRWQGFMRQFDPAGGGGGGQPQPNDPNAPTAMDPNAGPPAPGSAPTSAPTVNPMNPQRLPGAAVARQFLSSPKDYLESVKGTPAYQDALAAAHGNHAGAQQLLLNKAVKDGLIQNRQGEETMIPDGTNADGSTRYRTIRTPNLPAGMDFSRGAGGDVAEVHNIAGFVPAQGELEGVKTGAAVANTPRMLPDGAGAEHIGYIGDLQHGTPPALRGPQAPPGTLAGQGGATRPDYPAFAPRAPGAGSTPPVAPPGLPAKDQTTGLFHNNLWSDIPKVQIPHTPGQTTDEYTKAILGSTAKKHQELVDEYGKQSASGIQQMEYLDAAEKALPNAEVGPNSEWMTHHRGMLIQAFPSLQGVLGTDKVTPTLELNKQLTNAALQGARSTFGNRMTQNEVKLQTEEMSPSVEMTRAALTSLIHQAKMKAAYGIQQDKDYSEYHAAGGDPNRFESQYNVRRPLTRFAAQYDTPQTALDRLKQRPEILPDFIKRYGWNPKQ